MTNSMFVNMEAAKLTQKEYFELSEGIDWNCYKSNEEEHLYLKRNIGYALFGPPIVNNVLGYPKEQAKNICEIYRAICDNHYLVNTGELHIRIIYICVCFENNKGDNGRVPVFVLKKCVESNNPCTIFIDNHSRVYKSWTAYLKDNKLPKCLMVCPMNGKYTGSIYLNEEGGEEVDVLLEYHESPACSLSSKVLNVVDTAGTVVSVGTTLTVGASAVITLGPPVLIAAGIAGLGSGLLCAGRSIYSLVDRKIHQQTIGLNNAEARSHWFTSAMGAISVTACGATAALTKVTRSGAVVGTGTKFAFNTISAVNLLGCTANGGMTIYHFYEKWNSEDKITMMDVFQLSSSILFFHMSVTNFRTANAIIQETQTSVISEYQDTLRSKRHSKALRKAHLEAKRLNGEIAGNAEIIKGIKHIANPNEYFAGLVKMNKDLNKRGARYTINADGQVVINSVTIIDPVEFNNMSIKSRKVALNNLPVSEPSATLVTSKSWLNSKIADITTFCNTKSSTLLVVGNIRDCSETIALLLKDFCQKAIDCILNITIKLLDEITAELEAIKNIHPLVSPTVLGVQYVIEYLKRYANSLNLEMMQTIDRIFEDIQNNMKDIVDSFQEWWTDQKTNFYSIPNEYIDINVKEKIARKCKTCQGIYFAK